MPAGGGHKRAIRLCSGTVVLHSLQQCCIFIPYLKGTSSIPPCPHEDGKSFRESLVLGELCTHAAPLCSRGPLCGQQAPPEKGEGCKALSQSTFAPASLTPPSSAADSLLIVPEWCQQFNPNPGSFTVLLRGLLIFAPIDFLSPQATEG